MFSLSIEDVFSGSCVNEDLATSQGQSFSIYQCSLWCHSDRSVKWDTSSGPPATTQSSPPGQFYVYCNKHRVIGWKCFLIYEKQCIFQKWLFEASTVKDWESPEGEEHFLNRYLWNCALYANRWRETTFQYGLWKVFCGVMGLRDSLMLKVVLF